MAEEDKFELTPEHITWIRENFKTTSSLRDMVTGAFGLDENGNEYDVRSHRGRAVRQFLAQEGKEYQTARSRKTDLIKLTDGNREVILELNSRGKNTLEIAQQIFGDTVQQLSAEHRVVAEFIKDSTDDIVNRDVETIDMSRRGNKYSAPQKLSMVISKINAATDVNWDESKMTRMELMCAEKLKNRLNNSRFKTIYGSFSEKEDALLFEQEFIRFTYDKADLSQEEVYQYMELNRDACSLEAQYRHIQTLNEEFEAAAQSPNSKEAGLTIRLSTMIKEKEDALNKTKVRIKHSINALQGDRKERLNKQNQGAASFLAIVKAFQEEDDRRLMIKMAEMQRLAIREEADKLESMEEWKARVLGLSKETLI